jgi:hypothetical protein
VVGNGLATFRTEAWVSIVPDTGSALVEVRPPAVEHVVSLKTFWQRLGRNGISPREMILRKRIRELLKQIGAGSRASISSRRIYRLRNSQRPT